MDQNYILSIFTKKDIERIQSNDVFWWVVSEMKLSDKFNAFFVFLQSERKEDVS